MMVIFTSRSEKKAIYTVRRILDSFADRIGNDTWKTVITQEGLLTCRRFCDGLLPKVQQWRVIGSGHGAIASWSGL